MSENSKIHLRENQSAKTSHHTDEAYFIYGWHFNDNDVCQYFPKTVSCSTISISSPCLNNLAKGHEQHPAQTFRS